jgi:hypothetical protein
MIENDAFFVRKIVHDDQQVQLEIDHVAKFLNDHILGENIKIETLISKNDIQDPKYSSITKSLLNANLSLGRTADDKKTRDAWLDNAILEVDNHEV